MRHVSLKISSFFGIVLIAFSWVFAQPSVQQPIQSYRDFAPDYATEMRYRTYLSQTDSQAIDVLHYDLDLNLSDHASEFISGELTMTGVATGTLPSLEIDLHSQLTVTLINTPGDGQNDLTWQHENNIITITPTSAWSIDDTVQITITYEGTPVGDYGEGMDYSSHSGTPVIYTLSEPDFASGWWPCIDIPGDKATFTGHFTVPDNWIAASNGALIDTTVDESAGTATFTWEEHYPIATYLVSVTATNFVHFSDTYTALDGSTMPVDYYVYPEDSVDAAEDFNVTVPMIETFAELFGEYPFLDEKYGMAEFPWGGGMEHQTLTSYGAALINGNHTYDWINAHEIAHQWFGDLITLGDWRDIWLNEGFATYGEAMWNEMAYGETALQSRLANYRTQYFSEDARIRYPIYDPPEGYLFGSAEYEKGAWVLHMLRNVVGDDNFFDILSEYRDTYAFSSAVTTDFIDVVNSVTDTTYQWFFDQWIYEAGYPEYEFEYSVSESGGGYTTQIIIEQVQSNAPVFTMPIQFMLAAASDTVHTTHWNSAAIDSFSVQTDFLPESVHFDPDNAILKKVYSSQRFGFSGGIVTGPDSTGIPFANVAITGPYGGDTQPVQITDTTDANGEFSILLRPGMYLMQGWKEGYIQSNERTVDLTAPISGFSVQLTQPQMVLNAPDSIMADITPGEMFRDTIRMANDGFGPMLSSATPHPINPLAGESVRSSYSLMNQNPFQVAQQITQNFAPPHNPGNRSTATAPEDTAFEVIYEEPEPDTTRFVDIHKMSMQTDDQTLHIYLETHNTWGSLGSFQWLMFIETDMETPEADFLIIVTDFEQFSGAVFEYSATSGNYQYVASASYEEIAANSDEFTMGFPLSAFGDADLFLFRSYTVNAQTGLPFDADYFPDLNLSPLLYSLSKPAWLQLSSLYDVTQTDSTTEYVITIDGNDIPQIESSGVLLFYVTDPTQGYALIPYSFNANTGTRSTNTLPKTFRISRNYPNPFNPSTWIDYALPKPGSVTFNIYNVRGELVFESREEKAAGHYMFQWGGRGTAGMQASGGIYFVRVHYVPVHGTEKTETQKIIYLK